MTNNYFRVGGTVVFFDDDVPYSISAAWDFAQALSAPKKPISVHKPYAKGPGYGCHVIGLSPPGQRPEIPAKDDGAGALALTEWRGRVQNLNDCWRARTSHIPGKIALRQLEDD
jgi:hypothetical protein